MIRGDDDQQQEVGAKRKRATNDLAEAPFSMVKEGKHQCGITMSIHKCTGEAMMRGNHFVDRTVTEKGTEYGWLLRQVEWVQ